MGTRVNERRSPRSALPQLLTAMALMMAVTGCLTKHEHKYIDYDLLPPDWRQRSEDNSVTPETVTNDNGSPADLPDGVATDQSAGDLPIDGGPGDLADVAHDARPDLGPDGGGGEETIAEETGAEGIGEDGGGPDLCTPWTCEQHYLGQCGALEDGCGGQLACSCGDNQECLDNQCLCQYLECDSACCALGEICIGDEGSKSCCLPSCFDNECGPDGCGGSCWTGEGAECDDGNPCTDDSCDGGTCSHQLKPLAELPPGECLCESSEDCLALEDDNNCNGTLHCEQPEGSEEGTPMVCLVDPLTVPVCDDGLFCNGQESCLPPSGECLPGNPPLLSDEVDCTIDSCSEADNKVVHAPDHPFCNDGNECTTDLCDSGLGCQHVDLTGTPCSDDDLCTAGDLCEDGNCAAGDAVDCKDQNPCSQDLCDAADGCLHPPVVDETPCPGDGDQCTADKCLGGVCLHPLLPLPGAPCDDGNACTTSDVCQESGLCLGAPISCDDGLICTSDKCTGAGICDHQLSQGFCLIEGVCVAHAMGPPDNPCLRCDTYGDLYAWTPLTGSPCPNQPNATGVCEEGTCVVGSCADGWLDFNGLAADGCERTVSATVWVNAGNTGDPLADGSKAHPWPAIGQAIAAAGSKALVLVAPGTYFEEVAFGQAKAGMTLMSLDGPQATVIVPGQLFPGILIQSADIAVSGFSITGGIFGVHGDGAVSELKSVQLADLVITGQSRPAPYTVAGIFLQSAGDVDIRSVEISQVEGEDAPLGVTGGNAEGITVSSATSVALKDCVIQSVRAGNGGDSVAAADGGGPGGQAAGLYLLASGKTTVRNCYVADIIGGFGGKSGISYAGLSGADGGMASGVRTQNVEFGQLFDGVNVYHVAGGVGGEVSNSIKAGKGGDAFGFRMNTWPGSETVQVVMGSATAVYAGMPGGGGVAGLGGRAAALFWGSVGAPSSVSLDLRNFLAVDIQVSAGSDSLAACIDIVQVEAPAAIGHLTCNGVGNWAGKGAGVVIRKDGWAAPVSVVNSIFSDVIGFGIRNEFDDPKPVTVSYSNFHECTQGTALGASLGAGILQVPPDYLQAPTGDFHLKPSSPLVDAGDPLSTCSLEPQPNGCRVNLGAYGGTAQAATSPKGTAHCDLCGPCTTPSCLTNGDCCPNQLCDDEHQCTKIECPQGSCPDGTVCVQGFCEMPT